MNYKDCLVCICVFNNGISLKHTLESIPLAYDFDFIIIDDGSTDGAVEKYAKGIHVIKHKKNTGIGSSIRDAIDYAQKNHYQVLVTIPGNNKNTLTEVKRLVDPIIQNKADFVQGSRYLPGSRRDHTPFFRLIMVKVIAILFSILSLRKITDSMEGFRAWRLTIFNDPDINIHQEWLNRYGLETYLFYKITMRRKYRYYEVPVSKVYPKYKKNIINKYGQEYTKIRPIIDWWDILRPIPFLLLGIKK
jgi:dolichol-phosphate mannosyltransferase